MLGVRCWMLDVLRIQPDLQRNRILAGQAPRALDHQGVGFLRPGKLGIAPQELDGADGRAGLSAGLAERGNPNFSRRQREANGIHRAVFGCEPNIGGLEDLLALGLLAFGRLGRPFTGYLPRMSAVDGLSVYFQPVAHFDEPLLHDDRDASIPRGADVEQQVAPPWRPG